MAKNVKITNHDLAALGIDNKELLKTMGQIAKVIIKKQGVEKRKVLELAKQVWENPQTVEQDKNHPFAPVAAAIVKYKTNVVPAMQEQTWKLHKGIDFAVYGSDFIDHPTLNQMGQAMKLPITKAGALMPDAHLGYGLPIGGVLATDVNTVIPYAVGVDIACRMCLSVFNLPGNTVFTEAAKLKKILQDHTVFGSGGETKVKYDETLFDRQDWNAFSGLKRLKDKAWRQLGTSGTGNHFVEWGIIEVTTPVAGFDVPAGQYLALLSHSGSRGFGASIANNYSRIAMQKVRLVKEVKHFAWLDLDSEAGQEYWLAMNLAGDYSSANHHEIHNKMARALHQRPIARVENHHNFAWKETLPNGQQAMVHRKGATPAGKGVLGIIPGSMAAPGYVVVGKGDAASINSAAHGAGRAMSRSEAKNTFTAHQMKKRLGAQGIQLIGGDVDESPMAYKNIEHVMAAQTDLVTVLAKFTPQIVRMADGREPGED
jgi:tRNA-splicing ligase RtcB (3'-phosphate/5'-hydroxy nucleic acid ligase)